MIITDGKMMLLRRSGSLETPEEDSEEASPSSDAPEWTGVSFRRQRSLRSHDDIAKFISRQAGWSFFVSHSSDS